MKELRELERSKAIASAVAEHETAEERLAGLRAILSTRNREPYNWQEVWASQGEFRRTEFQDPAPIFSLAQSEAIAATSLPIAPWVLLYGACAGLAILFGNVLTQLLTVPFMALVVFWLVSTVRSRRSLSQTDFQNKSLEFDNDLVRLRSDYDAAQESARIEWMQAEAARATVRTAIEKGDLQTIVSVLESELQNEPLPVPLVFELELDSTEDAKIEVTLPDLDDIPGGVTSLTQRGKLSTKAMSQKDHTDLFADLCAGLCLRLIYEALRVVPSLGRIELFGTTSGTDPASGHQREFIALHVNATRTAIHGLNLDNVDPSSALAALGGRFSCDRRGALSPIDGLVGIPGTD